MRNYCLSPGEAPTTPIPKQEPSRPTPLVELYDWRRRGSYAHPPCAGHSTFVCLRALHVIYLHEL